MSAIHLMRPEWLWCLLPALVLGIMLWRQRQRSGSWNSVIDPALLKHLVSNEGGGRSRNLLPWLFCAWPVTCKTPFLQETKAGKNFLLLYLGSTIK